MRIAFCGVIEGEVTVRPGESKEAAILRASDALNDLLQRQAKRFGRVAVEGRGTGPVVGLEPVDPER